MSSFSTFCPVIPKSCGFMTFLKVSEPLKILVAADIVTKTMVERIAIVAKPTAFFLHTKNEIGYGNHVVRLVIVTLVFLQDL